VLTPWCEVWGSPIAHSLSPVLHRAAYTALGLGWTYGRREVGADRFAGELEALADGCRGLSLTMPLKEAALAAASVVDDAARATGAANTLLPTAAGWSAHNTDVVGVRRALAEAGAPAPRSVLVVGSGATARSTVAAVAGTARRVVLMVRDRARPETLEQARASGLEVEVVGLGQWTPTDVVVSTVPPASVVGLDRLPVADASTRPVLLDAVYAGGTTPLERAAAAAGWVIAPGTDMLLHQATRQVELMTGRPAPLEAMRAALDAVLAARAVRTSQQAAGRDDRAGTAEAGTAS
jgi:shikimate dehydrogenase